MLLRSAANYNNAHPRQQQGDLLQYSSCSMEWDIGNSGRWYTGTHLLLKKRERALKDGSELFTTIKRKIGVQMAQNCREGVIFYHISEISVHGWGRLPFHRNVKKLKRTVGPEPRFERGTSPI